MPAKIIDGNALAKTLLADVERGVAEFKTANGFPPGLAVVLVGKSPASVLYVGKKETACKAVGIKSKKIELDENVSEKELIAEIEKLNADERVHGILVQLPLPKQIAVEKITDAVRPEKDVDGFNTSNLGRLFAGRECMGSCTARGMMRLLEHTGVEPKGKHAVVVGHSIIVGKPLAAMLLNKDATVTVCHKETRDLAAHTKQADILATAVGKAGLIKADMVKQGAVVLDAGIVKASGEETGAGKGGGNCVGDKIVGDVDFEKVKEKAAWITPVPGGVGPMTVACLMENTLKAAETQLK